jgi:hypothetical protein
MGSETRGRKRLSEGGLRDGLNLCLLPLLNIRCSALGAGKKFWEEDAEERRTLNTERRTLNGRGEWKVDFDGRGLRIVGHEPPSYSTAALRRRILSHSDI